MEDCGCSCVEKGCGDGDKELLLQKKIVFTTCCFIPIKVTCCLEVPPGGRVCDACQSPVTDVMFNQKLLLFGGLGAAARECGRPISNTRETRLLCTTSTQSVLCPKHKIFISRREYIIKLLPAINQSRPRQNRRQRTAATYFTGPWTVQQVTMAENGPIKGHIIISLRNCQLVLVNWQ